MSDTSWLSLSVDGLGFKPAVFSFDLGEGILGGDLLAVSFLSPRIFPGTLKGSHASFSFEFDGKKEYFNGVIASCLARQSTTDALMVTLKIKTMRHLMDKEKKCAVHCKSDMEEIARSIFGKAGILNVKYDLSSFHEANFKMQYNESDIVFLQRLFEDYGIIEFVKHSEGRSELVISDGDVFLTSAPIFADCSLETSERGNIFHGHGHFPLRPGMSFDAFGETFVVYSASHIGSQSAAFGIKDKDEGYVCQITAFSKHMLSSLPRHKSKPQVPGVMVARIEGFRNSPAAIDSQGRYIVRMPFDEESPDMASSLPVHLAQGFAGTGCGIHFPLRKGTPVLLAFEDGDIDRPVIVGALPEGVFKGPAHHEKSFQNILRTIGGLEFVLDDEAKSLGVKVPEKISAEAGKELSLESDNLLLEGEKQCVFKTAGGLDITLDGSSGTLTVESPGDIVLDAGGDIVLDAKSVEIGDGVVAAAGTATEAATLSGNALASQSAGTGAASSLGIVASTSQASQEMGAGVSSRGRLLVREVIGEKEVAPGGEAQYWVVKYSKSESEVSQEEKNGIRWAVKVDGGIRELKDKNGSHITLEIKNDWAGKEIAVMACVEGFNENVCQKTMVGKARAGGSVKTSVAEVDGDKEAYPGQKVKYRVSKYNKGEASDEERKNVRWAVGVGDKQPETLHDEKGREMKGQEAEIEMKKDWAGKTIAVMAYLKESQKEASRETKVAEFPILIAQSDHKPGKDEYGEKARDMYYGDMTKEDIFKMFPEHDTYGATFGDANAYFDCFRSVATNSFSNDKAKIHELEFPENLSKKCRTLNEASGYADLRSNILSMIDNFRYGGGKNYSNEHLTKAVMCHENTINFFNEIRKEFENKIKKYCGNLIKMKNEKLAKELMDKRPMYNTMADIGNGLKIALNDTWAYEAWITEYRLEKDGTYAGRMKIFIYDHFGLDKEDLADKKYARRLVSFCYWFILQHWEGFEGQYKPFVTVIEKEFSFKGRVELCK